MKKNEKILAIAKAKLVVHPVSQEISAYVTYVEFFALLKAGYKLTNHSYAREKRHIDYFKEQIKKGINGSVNCSFILPKNSGIVKIKHGAN